MPLAGLSSAAVGTYNRCDMTYLVGQFSSYYNILLRAS